MTSSTTTSNSASSAAPSSSSSSMEPLYGQKDLAEFCEFVIASLFDIAPGGPAGLSSSSSGLQQQQQQQQLREGIDTPPYTPPPEGSAPQHKQPPVLVEFIAYALYRTRLPTCIVHQCLLLLSRLKQRYPSARGTSSSPHRLFLSSLMLSAKISMDDTYSNKSWAIVGSSFFPLREVNQMERELFAFLGWNVVVQKEELDSFVASAEASYAEAKAARKAERAQRRRMEEEEAREARHRQATNAARALLRPHTYRHHSHSPSRSSNACEGIASSSAPYTPTSMQHSPVASTSSAASIASSPSSGLASPQQITSSSRSSSSSRRQQAGHSSSHHPYHSSNGQYTPSSESSLNSSAVSSAFPSATHSPTSPASEPFSAGPQTPDSAFNYLQSHPQQQQHVMRHLQHQQQMYQSHPAHYGSEMIHSADFPEADSYMSTRAKSSGRSISPPHQRKAYPVSATSPSYLRNSARAEQIQA